MRDHCCWAEILARMGHLRQEAVVEEEEEEEENKENKEEEEEDKENKEVRKGNKPMREREEEDEEVMAFAAVCLLQRQVPKP